MRKIRELGDLTLEISQQLRGRHTICAATRILLLQCRGLGDAVISTAVINSLGESFPGLKVDILGTPEALPIFSKNRYVGRFFVARFPIASGFRYSLMDGLGLLRTLQKIRNDRYDICLNLVGDYRENGIGWLTRSRIHIAPFWDKNHPMRNMLRIGFDRFVDIRIPIGLDEISVYSATEALIRAIGCSTIAMPKVYLGAKNGLRSGLSKGSSKRIGLHPFARQECRLWDGEKWKDLCLELLLKGHKVVIFGAPSNLDCANSWFGSLMTDNNVELCFTELSGFLERLSSIELLIGLDSFSIHAAHALGVPGIMLDGPNDFQIWSPPTAQTVRGVHECPHYPCFNKPKCMETVHKYVCMKSISVSSVLGHAHSALSR